MYVSSISDIAKPLCVRIQPGYYSFGPVHKRQGFKFGIAQKTLVNSEMFRVHSTSTHSVGLSNTFNGGEIRNKVLVNIICDNFLKNFSNELLYYLFCQETVVEAQVDFKNLYESFELIEQQLQQKYDNVDINAYFRKHGFANYNNLPILLFLTTIVSEDHFDKLTFVALSKFDNNGHWFRCYRVDLNATPIGALVHTNEFYNMSGVQMGLATYSEDRLRVHTFANFEPKTQDELNKINACTY